MAVRVWVELLVPTDLKFNSLHSGVPVLLTTSWTHMYSLDCDVLSACPFTWHVKLVIVAILGISGKVKSYVKTAIVPLLLE